MVKLSDFKMDVNTGNAVTTGVFAGLSTLVANFSSNSLYKYYKQQEELYVKAAQETARRLEIKGALALNKLKTTHALQQGTNELAAAAGGGRLSGSALDVLVNNYRYNAIDERTQQLETLWSVTETKRNGYNGALGVAAKASTLAAEQKGNVLRALTHMAAVTYDSLSKDKEQGYKNIYIENKTNNEITSRQQALEAKYGTTPINDLNSLFLNPEINEGYQRATALRESLLKINPDTDNALQID